MRERVVTDSVAYGAGRSAGVMRRTVPGVISVEETKALAPVSTGFCVAGGAASAGGAALPEEPASRRSEQATERTRARLASIQVAFISPP